MSDMMTIRVTCRYKGEEGTTYVGQKLTVRAERARAIIAAGNGAPIVGPSEAKAEFSSGKEAATTGGAEQSSLRRRGRPSKKAIAG